MKTRIAVFVSGGGTNLQALIDASQRGELPSGELALVLSSSPMAYALERAAKAGIPTAVVRSRDENHEQTILDTLRAHSIDMIVLAGYMSILSEDFTKRFPSRILNVHPSLIPSFCGKGYYGLRVHEEALRRGVKVTGATVHFVNEIPDGGEILLQKAVDVLPDDTPETLQRRVMEQAEWKLLPQATETVAHKIMEERE
jgi:phosphoribosylglycinamide formyltransferase-1